MPKVKSERLKRVEKEKEHAKREDTLRHFLTDPFRSRKIPSQNVISRLDSRQTFGSRPRRGALNANRAFYTNVFPNYTLVNVEKPPCYLRKFTPDGRRFIAFSQSRTQLEVYLYRGPSAMGKSVHLASGDHLSEVGTPSENKMRKVAFKKFFTLEHAIPLTAYGGQQLNRECSLFSEDGDFVIVGSAQFIPDDHHPPLHETMQNNESVAPNPRNPLEHYTLYAVEIAEGILVDKIVFKTDKIFLSHNQGLYLYRDTLAVLSVQHQTVHIFKFNNGKFTPVLQVGRLLYEDDSFLLSSTLTARQQMHLPGSFVYREYREETINMLKHRMLTFLYRRAEAISKAQGDRQELRMFYQYFDQIKDLRIWKMQLLDEDHLLLRYASDDVVTLRSTEPNAQLSLFMVYNMTTTEVLGVYDNTSEQLVEMFEGFSDFFRNTNLNPGVPGDDFLYASVTSSASNNIYVQLTQQRFKQTIVSAKNGGVQESRKRVLAQLPIGAQSFSGSPYLDLSLFSYDEKWVSVMERPKPCGEHPILFYGRESGLCKFRIFAGIHGRPSPASARRLVAFTFHPTDPFAISVQKTNMDYVVNFHVRKAPN